MKRIINTFFMMKLWRHRLLSLSAEDVTLSTTSLPKVSGVRSTDELRIVRDPSVPTEDRRAAMFRLASCQDEATDAFLDGVLRGHVLLLPLEVQWAAIQVALDARGPNLRHSLLEYSLKVRHRRRMTANRFIDSSLL